MANYVVSDTNLTLIADAIRAKSGHNELLEWPNEYKTSIDNLNPVDMCIKTVTDNIVSVSDAAQYDAKNATIKIEPVQDLHGYDSPWPAGGGVNILDPNLKFSAQTVRGVTLTTDNGYEYKLTGTGESGSGNLQTNNIPTAECLVYPAGTYTVVGFVASTYHTNGSWFSNRIGTFTVDEDFIIRSGYREVAAGGSYNTSAFIAMVEGTTAPTIWTPYSNICPITGWTRAKVTRTGKNLINVVGERTITAQTTLSTLLTSQRGYYTASLTATNNGSITGFLRMLFSKGSTTVKQANANIAVGATAERITLTVDASNTDFDAISFAVGGASTGYSVTVKDCQIEFGSTATEYELYQRETYDITFPSEAGTVYGGTLNVVTGKLTVTHGVKVLNGSETYYWSPNNALAQTAVPNGIVTGAVTQFNVYTKNSVFQDKSWAARATVDGTIGMFYGGSYLYVKYSKITSVADAQAFFTENPTTVVYELATPITYTLTPQQIALLRGGNTLWADTGDTTLTYYTEDFADLADEIGYAEGGDY